MSYRIIKRDGTLEDFDKNKIINAINLAFEDIDGTVTNSSKGLINRTANFIQDEVESADAKDMMLSVEDIQNLIVYSLTDPSPETPYRFDVNRRNQLEEALYDLFKCLFDLMYNEKVSRSYLNTNLLYNPEYLLFPVLDMALSKNLLGRLNFTTSGDETDRFVGIKGEEKRALFYENLKRLRNLYPEMNIMVNLILTKQFCDSVLNGKFNINEYEKKHGVIMNVIPYIKLKNDERTPSREEVFSTLIRLNSQQPGYLKRVCDNHTTHPIRKLLHYENGKLVNVSCDLNPCGHTMNFTRCYNNSESCFACDVKKLYTLMSTD